MPYIAYLRGVPHCGHLGLEKSAFWHVVCVTLKILQMPEGMEPESVIMEGDRVRQTIFLEKSLFPGGDRIEVVVAKPPDHVHVSRFKEIG